MSACGQDTAHLDTHEEYTKELKEDLSKEQTYLDEITFKIDDLEEQIEEFGELS